MFSTFPTEHAPGPPSLPHALHTDPYLPPLCPPLGKKGKAWMSNILLIYLGDGSKSLSEYHIVLMSQHINHEWQHGLWLFAVRQGSWHGYTCFESLERSLCMALNWNNLCHHAYCLSSLLQNLSWSIRIVGNFRGRKLSRNGENDFHRANFRRLLACAMPEDTTAPRLLCC